MLVHLDTDFLVYALSQSGPERRRLVELSESTAEIQVCSVVWYEFSRGPRTPQQLAVARSFFFEDGIIPLSEEVATKAAEIFRQLGSPRKRTADIVIGVTAAQMKALLLTRNTHDFDGIPDLAIEFCE
jgi:predicted nucleic acid-binding protein